MKQLPLGTRLILAFVAINALCFIAVGLLLFGALATRITAPDDTNIVLTTRHLRRLATEFASQSDLNAHNDRLVSLVLGDPSLAMQVSTSSGQSIILHNPSGLLFEPLPAVDTDQRIVTSSVHGWRDRDGAWIHGVATHARLQDGSDIVIAVARNLTDRYVVLRRYRRDIALVLAAGLLISAMLGLFLVRRALRPLHAMANQVHSITAQRLEARISIKNAPPDLQHLVNSLNHMLDRLERGFDRVWHFTVDLAHDLRTPLSNLRGTNEVALTRPRSVAEYESLLGSNIEECERVGRTIESVLFLARAENPSYSIRRTNMDLAEQLGLLADYFEGISTEADVIIEVTASGLVYADRELFRRAVNNLLANAIRYTPSGGRIMLRGQNVDNKAIVSVENPGHGIEPLHLPNIFDRFYRVDPSRNDSANSAGLGLAIVKSIMDLHGGTVSVKSDVDAVTCFTLTFPKREGLDGESPIV